MLKHRLIVGPLLILLFFALIVADEWLEGVPLTGPMWSWFPAERETLPRGTLLFFFLLAVITVGSVELTAIFRANHIAARRWLTALAAIAGLALSYSIPYRLDTIVAIAIVPTGMILVFMLALLIFSRRQNVEGVVAGAGGAVFAMVYLGLLAGFYLAIRRWHSGWWIVGIVMTTKMADTGAYFTGRAIGRHKLIPWLSPGKTWEGFVGGLLASTLTGAIFALLSGLLGREADHVEWYYGAALGAIFGVVGQLGDLTMSLFKRDAGIKDSSSLIPGFGGTLDVLDSPLLVAPVAFWLLLLIAPPPAVLVP